MSGCRANWNDMAAWDEVIQALRQGELKPLAEYLRAHPGRLHEQIGHRLADMIDGPPEATGWRLRLVNRPGLRNGVDRIEQQNDDRNRTYRIVKFIHERGGFDRLRKKQVLFDAAVEFELGEETIAKRIRSAAARRYRTLLEELDERRRQADKGSNQVGS